MIVDDDSDTANLFKDYLEEHGYQVESYTNPLNALSSFRPGHYDLLLIDVKMPIMNGFQLYRELKEVDETCKVCFITAFEVYYESLMEFFPNLDVTCFIKKPIAKEELLSRIDGELGL
jgi:DNA-binding response OmpR family regulator